MSGASESPDATANEDTEMTTMNETLVCGNRVQYDNSGVGHNWRDIDATDIPANVREEIECEMLDGGQDECECYVASNGCRYRW